MSELAALHGSLTSAAEQRVPKRLLDCFDRAFVVNLPQRTDRRREMEDELVRAGWADSGKIEFFPACKFEDAAGFPNLGARGCFMSHLTILKRAQRDRLRSVLMLEDDLAISPLLRQSEAEIVARLAQNDWAIAYLGHSDPEILDAVSPLSPFDGPVATTHFYGVRGDYIGQLVDFLEGVLSRPPGDPRGGPMHVDGAIHTYRVQHPDALTLVAKPNLGTQRSSKSDITTAWFDKIPLLGAAARMYRRTKAMRVSR